MVTLRPGSTRPTRRRLLRLLCATLALSLVAASCSDDEDAGSTTTTTAADADQELGADTDPSDGEADAATDEPRIATFDGAATEAPDEYDVVTVVQQGDPDAANVLVLVPGTSAGAGYFLPLGEQIVAEADDWQVWSIDRRENLLEDHSLLDARKAGEADTQEVFDHYLGWIGNDEVTEHFEPPTDDEVAFARDWGMAVAVEDVDVVVEEANRLGGDVVLGGHSLGGNITIAYATWDFDGAAGADKLAGIALVDGGSRPIEEEGGIGAELEALAEGSPFNDLLGLGLPWAPGVFNALGATATRLEPDEPSLAYQFPLLPEGLKPPVQPTNEGQYGYALDVDTSPPSLGLVHLTLGDLAEEGEPRGWDESDGLVPIQRAAAMFSGIEGIDGTAWYHPRRLTIDGGVTNLGLAHPDQELVGVRAVHGAELSLPLYAFETGFGQGRVLAGASLLAEQSQIVEEDRTFVERHDVTHTDPMGMAPDNPLVDTLVPFLRSLG